LEENPNYVSITDIRRIFKINDEGWAEINGVSVFEQLKGMRD
jgi:hypothetical protein